MEGHDNVINHLEMYDMAKRGGIEYVERALANGANPSWRNPDDMEKTYLHHAAHYDNPEIVRLLVAAGADVNEQDKFGNTPLFHAVCSLYTCGSLEATTTLLELGAETEIPDVLGNTPVMVACYSSSFQALVDAHANVKHKNNSGQTALHKLVDDAIYGERREDRLKMIEILLQKGIDPTEQDNNGYTPIDYAKQQEYPEMVTMMVGSTTASSTEKTSTESVTTPNYDLLLYVLTCGIVLYVAIVLYLVLD